MTLVSFIAANITVSLWFLLCSFCNLMGMALKIEPPGDWWMWALGSVGALLWLGVAFLT